MLKEKNKLFYILGGSLFLAALLVFFLLMLEREPLPPPETSQPEPTVTEPAGYYGTEEFMLDSRGFMTYKGAYSTGIDVSGYQGEIDWARVKADGISFVFIKVGSRGTTEGGLYPDTYAQSYYEGAKAAGLQVGVYFYSQAITVEEAEAEAEFTLELIEGWELDLPVAYDWEWGGDGSRTTELDRKTLTQCALRYCELIEKAGFAPMLYFNESQGLFQMNLWELKQYPFWLAQYDGELRFPYPIRFWQYSQTGTVDGIDGSVDLNICILP